MNISSKLTMYLECEKEKLDTEFPQNIETTILLFEKVLDFLNTDFEELSDNKIYRHFLISFREIICFAFEKEMSKEYLRNFFKIVNNDIFLNYLSKYAKSREKDIKFVMKRLTYSFISSWQYCCNDRDKVLKDIVDLIDGWM